MGPLPEAVYWRRRAGAAAAVASALLLGVWGLTALAAGPQPGPADAAGSAGTAGAPGAAGPAGAPNTTSSNAPSSSVVPSSGVAPSSGVVPSSGAAAADASASAAPGAAAPGAATASAAPSQTSGSCPDQVIGLTAQPSAAEYGPGQPREFRMVVTNIGATACSRDLNPALQELVVRGADGTRLWSSNDCYDAGSADVRTLVPGEQLVFGVVWAGRTSQPGCTGRDSVPAGSYQLVARLGELTSGPAPFRLVD